MTFDQLALAASVVFAGLWSGLLGMLSLVMHRMLAAMNGPDFERFLQAFLPVARKPGSTTSARSEWPLRRSSRL